MNLQVVFFGSSRPQLLPYVIPAFKKYCHIEQDHEVLFHEDFVYPKISIETISYLHNHPEIKVHRHNPNIGLGRAMDYMFKEHINAKYMLYMQDDWEFERPVEIDRLTWLMDRNPHINLILFNKYKNYDVINGFKQKQYTFDNVDLCLYKAWSFIPGLWRMNHAMKYWKVRETRPEGYFIRQFGKPYELENPEYTKEKIGAYLLGKSQDPKIVRHLGHTYRMAEWRHEQGLPGGNIEFAKNDKKLRAPWLPEEPKRPTDLGIYKK